MQPAKPPRQVARWGRRRRKGVTARSQPVGSSLNHSFSTPFTPHPIVDWCRSCGRRGRLTAFGTCTTCLTSIRLELSSLAAEFRRDVEDDGVPCRHDNFSVRNNALISTSLYPIDTIPKKLQRLCFLESLEAVLGNGLCAPRARKS